MSNNKNLMLLGKTGAGKSSLINYLYGEDVLETGSGRPVTPSGEFRKSVVCVPGPAGYITYTLYDSWGLEADKAERWKKEINGKLDATLAEKDFICGVIYCISYTTDRVEEFEVQILKEVLKRGYKVVIALTNADDARYESKRAIFRDKINKELGKNKNDYDIVDICSVAEEKIKKTSAPAQTFGKAELLKILEHDIEVNFANAYLKAISLWREEAFVTISTFTKQQHKAIDNFYSFWEEDTMEKQAKKFALCLEQNLKDLSAGIFSKLENINKESAAFFNTSLFEEKKDDIKLNWHDFFWLPVVIPLIPVAHFIDKSKLKKDFNAELDKSLKAIKLQIKDICKQAEKKTKPLLLN